MKKILASILLVAIAASHLCAQQAPTAAPVTPRTDWPTYPADQMPAGKNVTEEDIPDLANSGKLRDVLYLVGVFTVTARAEDRAVLRSNGKIGTFRVVAIYPPSIRTPAEGATIVRDATRGFLITDIRRGGDNQITVYVRDITIP